MDPRLVRGLSRLHVLHGDPVAAGGARRCGPRHQRRGVRLPGSGLGCVRSGLGDREADGMARGPALGRRPGHRRNSRGRQAVRPRRRGEPRPRRAAPARRQRRVGVAWAEGLAPLAGAGGCGRGHAGAARRPHALRRVPQARGDRRSGRPAGGRVGHDPVGGGRARGSGPGRRSHAAVPVRPVVQHLRRQPHVHDGRRVRLLARSGRGGALHRHGGPGHGLGPPPGPGRLSAGPHRAAAPVLGLPRAGSHRRAGADRSMAPSRLDAATEMDPGDRRAGRLAQCMVGAALLVEPGPAQRHGLGQRAPLPVVAVVSQLLRLQLPGQRPPAATVRCDGCRRGGAAVRQAGPAPRRARPHRGDLRGGLRGDARGAPVERAHPALLLPHCVPDSRPRPRRGDRVGPHMARPAARGPRRGGG